MKTILLFAAVFCATPNLALGALYKAHIMPKSDHYKADVLAKAVRSRGHICDKVTKFNRLPGENGFVVICDGAVTFQILRLGSNWSVDRI